MTEVSLSIKCVYHEDMNGCKDLKIHYRLASKMQVSNDDHSLTVTLEISKHNPLCFLKINRKIMFTVILLLTMI